MSIRSIIQRAGTAFYHLVTFGMEKEYSFPRYSMYLSMQKAISDRGLKLGGDVLSISHSSHLVPIINGHSKTITEANYPEVNIMSLPYADCSFDLVVSDQVFEHIHGLPHIAMSESLRVLRPGGWVLHTTCFFTPYHGPGDYWRWTAEGLGELARLSGSSEAISGGAGHPADALYGLFGWRWLGVPKARWHPLNWLARLDRPSYWNTCWVLAQK